MNITLEQSGVSALVSVKMEKADYQDAVKKELKNIAAKAEMPGFRKGKVPAGLINKRFGTEVKMNEINRLVGEKPPKVHRRKEAQRAWRTDDVGKAAGTGHRKPR